jgi:hypothetical protein
MACLFSKGIALATYEEKPGWVQAASLRASSSEIAWRSTRRASYALAEQLHHGIGVPGQARGASPASAVSAALPGRSKNAAIAS